MKNTMTNGGGNPGLGFGQAKKCGRERETKEKKRTSFQCFVITGLLKKFKSIKMGIHNYLIINLIRV
jgi:hypothetical protein